MSDKATAAPAAAPAPAEPAAQQMGAFPPSAQISSDVPEGTPAPAPAQHVQGIPEGQQPPNPFDTLFSPPDRTVHVHQPDQSVVDILEHDPFAVRPAPSPAPPSPPAAAPQAPTVSAPTAQEPSGQQPAVVPSTPPQAPPDPRDTENRLLREQLAAMQRALEQVSIGQQIRQAPQGPQTPQADDVQLPAVYQQVQIPEELLAQIGSEDPATWAGGLNSLIRGAAAMIHREVVRSVRQELPDRIGRHVQDFTQQTQQQQQVQTDYYSKYAHHANVKPLVAEIAAELQRTHRISGWSPELRDMIGAKVNERLMTMAAALGMVPPQQQQPPTPMAPPAPMQQPQVVQQVPRAPHVFGGTASPSHAGVDDGSPNSPQAIASLLY